MTINEKNRARYLVKKLVVGQWLLVMAVMVTAGVFGVVIPETGAILTASTTGLTTVLGLDYFTAPVDSYKGK